MSDIFKAMKAKKKRAVDPNAPPRPNLMTHDVKLRTVQQVVDDQSMQIHRLMARVDQLESRLRTQTDYLSQLHQRISKS
jgi:capsule polysaccharide export protein KpsE/RkpR